MDIAISINYMYASHAHKRDVAAGTPIGCDDYHHEYDLLNLNLSHYQKISLHVSGHSASTHMTYLYH